MKTHRPFRDRLENSIALLERRHDDAIFTRLYLNEARRAADEADERHRTSSLLGPLDGAVVTIKDLFDVAGEATTAGSTMLRQAPPAMSDAVVVDRLRRAGAVIFGKTNMTEFAYSGVGINPHWGTPGNALSPDRIPGGSSSGAGVSVALGIADIAIGSDTGGSVRVPASLNGVVGFKPTAARIPTTGAFPLSYSLDSIGPIADSVQSCMDADAVMAGQIYRSAAGRPIAGSRVAVLSAFLEEVEPQVELAFDASLRALESAGASLCTADFHGPISEMREILAAAPIVPVEAAQIHAHRLKAWSADFDPSVLRKIKRGFDISGPDYLHAIRRRHALIFAMDAQFGSYDYLVAPTTSMVAPLLSDVASSTSFDDVNAMLLRNTGFANFFDLCAISIPMPIHPMPAGIMLIGRRYHDHDLLCAARELERLLLS